MLRLICWNQVKTVLEGPYGTVEEISETRLRLVVATNAGPVAVVCDRLETGGEPWLALMIDLAPFCQTTSPALAIHLNVEFSIGSLCSIDGRSWMRQSLPIRGTSDRVLRQVVDTLVDQLDEVVALVQQPPTDNPGVYVAK